MLHHFIKRKRKTYNGDDDSTFFHHSGKLKNGRKNLVWRFALIFPTVSIVRLFILSRFNRSLGIFIFLQYFLSMSIFHSIKKHFIFLKTDFLFQESKEIWIPRVVFIDFLLRFAKLSFSIQFNRHLISCLGIVSLPAEKIFCE